MNRRDLTGLFILALFIRLLTALPQQQPNYMDAAYSYVNALNLLAGRGFVEDFVWNYLNNPPAPPQPSHLYWMPLTSILAWLGMLLGGASYRAAQLPFVVLSALLAPLSYGVTLAVGGRRWQGWLAGLLAIFSGFYFPFWTAIDNFTPFALAGALALFTAWRGISINNYQLSIINYQTTGQALPIINPPRSPASRPLLLLSGLCTGLAHLARADGPLLLLTILLVAIFYAPRTTHHALRHQIIALALYVLRFTFYLLLGYLLIISPWFLRNLQATGSLWPVAGSQTIWLVSYDDLFSYGRTPSAQTFFAQGLSAVLRGRWWALTTNLQTVLAVWGMIFLLPLAVVGAWKLRHHILLQLAALYGLLLFGAMTIVFAFPGARGGLFHSGAALLPFIYAAAAVGLEQSVTWMAARRRGWRPQQATRVFAAGLVVMAVGLSSFVYYQRVLKNEAWNRADAVYVPLADWIRQEEPQAVVMIGNPPAYRYHGGGLSVIVPNEPITVTLQAADQYNVDYLVLDPNHPAPLAGIYDQTTTHPRLTLVKTLGGVRVFRITE